MLTQKYLITHTVCFCIINHQVIKKIKKKSSLLDTKNNSKKVLINIKFDYRLAQLNNVDTTMFLIIDIIRMLFTIFTLYCKKLIFLTNKQSLKNNQKKIPKKITKNNTNLLTIHDKCFNFKFLNLLPIYFLKNTQSNLLNAYLISKVTSKNFKKYLKNILRSLLPQYYTKNKISISKLDNKEKQFHKFHYLCH